MFLKTLHISGFKSFAQPVRVELGPGITAIVGPNGSGKSNIVDAVRWVLGEQSARAIRGTKSEDVIFSGSAARHAQGMAEVSMVLDNADGRVAIDLAEVALARRLFRSGETEYLLNRRRARLRDVLDVAGQAGLGPDSYCVIGQGAIEQLVLQRPSERRALLADAADIRRHESRLTEIESNLAETQQNALRISAVVAELRPRLDRLRQQAERADRHRRARDDAEQLARAWYGRAIPAAQANVGRTERDRVALQAVIAEKRGAIGRAEALRTATQTRLRDARADVLEAEAQVSRARTDREQRRLVAAATAARSQSLVARVEQARAARISAAETVVALGGVAASSRQALDVELKSPQPPHEVGAVDQADSRLRELRRALAAHDRQLEERRREAENLERTGVRLRAEQDAAAANAASFASRRADIEGRLREIEPVRTSREDEAARAREETRRLDEEIIALKRVHVEQQTLRRRAEDALGAARRLADRGAGEERALASLDQRAPGGLSEATLIHQLPARREYQRAVAAALGAAARYGVVSSSGDAWEVDRGGRSESVLSPDQAPMVVDPVAFEASARAIVGPQVPFVAACEALESEAQHNLAARYLGTTLIVADLAAAVPLGRRLNTAGLSFQLATLDGHCLRSNGEHAFGPDQVVLQGIELRARQAELRQRLAEAQETISEAEAEFREARVGEGSAAEAVRVAEERRRVAGATLARAQEQLRLLQASVSHERTELERLLKSAPRVTRAEDIEALEAQLQAARAAQIRTLEARTDLAMQAETAELAHRQVMQDHARLAAEQGARVERLARLRQAHERDARELRAAEQQLAAMQVALERANQEMAALDQQHAPQQQEVARAEEATAVAESVAAAAREVLGSLDADAEATALAFERLQAELAEVRGEEATIAAAAEHASGLLMRLQVEAEAAAEQLATSVDDLRRGPDSGLELQRLDDDGLQRRLNRSLRELRGIGQVDYGVLAEFRAVEDRHVFLTAQLEDLAKAEALIREGMVDARERLQEQFRTVFEKVNARFKDYFRELFRGGDAELLLSGDPGEERAGVDIVAQPPGKRLNRLVTLSGGERALVGAALLLALISANPSPFCMLDEVDAALDEANVHRFVGTIREMARQTQFVLVTHNRATMEMADALYGVTMNPGAVSQILAIRLPD